MSSVGKNRVTRAGRWEVCPHSKSVLAFLQDSASRGFLEIREITQLVKRLSYKHEPSGHMLKKSWVWWCAPVFLVLVRQRRADLGLASQLAWPNW